MDKKKFMFNLYDMIAIDNIEMYKKMFKNSKIEQTTDSYGKNALLFYHNLSDEDKERFFGILKQVAIDTISHFLGIIDNSSYFESLDDDFVLTLEGDPKSIINGDLQDIFLEYAEEKFEEEGD